MAKKVNAKKNEDKRKLINISLVIFCISIVVFSVIGALIIDNFSSLQQVEDLSQMEEDDYKGEIDDRLRFIAMQDDDRLALREKETSEIEEDLNEPNAADEFFQNGEEVKKTKFEEFNEKYHKRSVVDDADIKASDSSDLEEIPYKKPVTSSSPLNLKVVIGNFDTKEAAQEELLQISSQFTAPPFIKYVNGKYALQVASFKTPETAYEFVNSLRHQGYNARIIEE